MGAPVVAPCDEDIICFFAVCSGGREMVPPLPRALLCPIMPAVRTIGTPPAPLMAVKALGYFAATGIAPAFPTKCFMELDAAPTCCAFAAAAAWAACRIRICSCICRCFRSALSSASFFTCSFLIDRAASRCSCTFRARSAAAAASRCSRSIRCCRAWLSCNVRGNFREEESSAALHLPRCPLPREHTGLRTQEWLQATPPAIRRGRCSYLGSEA
mmetsp:Transcript_17749/g.40223  ORF Transcript_17749/g.40223 Transcript_17749/m.40223 type:complete len:215 (+) Transcript_17749:1451-2095(+)